MKWKIKVQLFNIYLNHYNFGWGIDVVRISWDMMDSASLFKLYAYKSNRVQFGFDLLFMRRLVDVYRDNLADKMLWNKNRTTWFDRMMYNILNIGL